jgi:DNA topoisomerase VI subunit B
MALVRTGGEKTDELLGKNGSGPEGLPHSIIVTPEGVEGAVPVLSGEALGGAVPSNGAPAKEEKTAKPSRLTEKTRRGRRSKRGTAGKPTTRAMRRKA